MTGLSNGVNGNQIGTQSTPLDPRLGPLQNNGGPTMTHALMEDSPAIDAGNALLAVDINNNPLTTDQRGYARTYGLSVDIGAFEWNPEVPIMNVNLDDLGQTSVGSNSTIVAFPTTEYGHAQVLGFWISNIGDVELTLDFTQYGLPKGISFYQMPATTIAPGGETYLALKWDGLGKIPLGSSVRIATNLPPHLDFIIKLSGSLLYPISVPEVDVIGLLNDTGVANDMITYNPTVTGTVSGDFSGSSVRVEFDHTGNRQADSWANVWVSGGTFT